MLRARFSRASIENAKEVARNSFDFGDADFELLGELAPKAAGDLIENDVSQGD